MLINYILKYVLLLKKKCLRHNVWFWGMYVLKLFPDQQQSSVVTS